MAGDPRQPPSAVTPPAPAAEAAAAAHRERERGTLLAELARSPWDFGFCHTLRRLDCLQPERPRIGATARPADDPVRLGQRPSMRFAPSELAGLETSVGGRAPRLQVYFLGLLGPNGPLPLHLTEYARERQRNAGDPTFARFLDLFNHRMLALLYRAWAQAQPAVSFDRPDQDRFGAYLASLSGTAMPAFQARDAMPDLAKRHYAGHLSCQTRHPEGLESILRHLMDLPVRIQEFVGRWLELPADCRLRIGESPQTGALGIATTLGGRVWDHQSKFRVRIGPLRLGDYLSLLPGNPALTRVKSVVRNYAGDALEWDLNPVLAAAEVPRLRLGTGLRLGWTTWLASGPLGRDGDDLKLDPYRERPEVRLGADQRGAFG
ncbi:MAG TPA: type VI secretion system baseplate subunit TssG [Lamprocystis sp. (in: g-proteobacteria)]|nr:type VI secretion system baseplate subunit TssG [Lamprocystis sp. (in: g-proteobacteria)]